MGICSLWQLIEILRTMLGPCDACQGEVLDMKDMALLDNIQRMTVQRAVASGKLSIAEALSACSTISDFH